jgi:hypothetical protein
MQTFTRRELMKLGAGATIAELTSLGLLGWSYIRATGEYVLRIGGDLLEGGHINLWPPSWWF